MLATFTADLLAVGLAEAASADASAVRRALAEDDEPIDRAASDLEAALADAVAGTVEQADPLSVADDPGWRAAVVETEGIAAAEPRFEAALDLLVEGEFDTATALTIDDWTPVYDIVDDVVEAWADAGREDEAIRWCRRGAEFADRIGVDHVRTPLLDRIDELRAAAADRDSPDTLGDWIDDLL